MASPVREKAPDRDEYEVTGRPSSIRQTKHKTLPFSVLAIACTSTVLFGITVWFAASTLVHESGVQAWMNISFSSTVTILRILQGLTSTLSAVAVAQAYEGIQWTLAGRDHGVRLVSFLALSPTTSIVGASKFIFGRRQQLSDRAFGFLRLFSLCVLSVASLVLFGAVLQTPSGNTHVDNRTVKPNSITAYHQTTELPVFAGTGPFNGSFVEPFLKSIDNVVPFWALASTYNFVTNSKFSIVSQPISCPDTDTTCDSYIFPGGTYLMYPQPSPVPVADSAIVIPNAPGTQIDYAQGLHGGDQFMSQDCVVYGDRRSLVGVTFCLATSKATPGAIIAGVFACPNGTEGGTCHTQTPGSVPNVTTTMTVYSRQATTVCGARNNSILSISNLGEPTQDLNVNTTAIKLAAGWLLNYTASGVPAESSLNFWFWFAPSGTYSAIWESNAYTSLQSLLAFILWEFCTNNNENPAVAVELQGQMPNLPDEYKTTALISTPYTRFLLNRAAFATYVVLEGVALLFCWGIMLWRCVTRHHSTQLSSYPLIDFAGKLREGSGVQESSSGYLRPHILPEADDRVIRRRLTDVEVVVARQTGETGT